MCDCTEKKWDVIYGRDHKFMFLEHWLSMNFPHQQQKSVMENSEPLHSNERDTISVYNKRTLNLELLLCSGIAFFETMH